MKKNDNGELKMKNIINNNFYIIIDFNIIINPLCRYKNIIILRIYLNERSIWIGIIKIKFNLNHFLKK